MNIAKCVVSETDVENFDGEMLVAFVGRNENGGLIADECLAGVIGYLEEIHEFKGKCEETLVLYRTGVFDFPIGKAKRLLIAGFGDLSKQPTQYESMENFRLIGGSIAAVCRKAKIECLGLSVPLFSSVDSKIFAENVLEGILLGEYSFNKYKKQEPEESYCGLQRIVFFADKSEKKIRKACTKAIHSAFATRIARDMANEPGNTWTPAAFAKYAVKAAKELKLKCTVLDKNALTQLKMGGILAVNQGSKEPPKMVILDYNPNGKCDTLLLVGKGLTFDSGGVSLKPAQGMMEMKYDMCGGAAVLSVMEAVGREKPDLRVVAIVPTTDNMSGGGALKPGDIITHYNGVTSEIENTDAEGRLILADALAYGIETFQPDGVIDLATLTGAVIIALGHHHTGLLSNSDILAEIIIEAGKMTGEPIWRLPLGELYAKQLKSQNADMKNSGGRPGGSITAAEYLHRFVGDIPWAHLDIAGTAWDFTEKSYVPKGPSGIGTRILLNLIRTWEKGQLQ